MNATVEQKLVYDVGAHHGTDTEHYLSLGYRVLAVEADPTIAIMLREKFRAALAEKRLTLLQCGIADKEGELPFFVCPEITAWNSFDPTWARARGKKTVEVPVKTRRFDSILEEFGTPHLMKVDIEGFDAACVRALNPSRTPAFVTFEADAVEGLELALYLHSLGYRKFSLIEQYNFRPVALPHIGTAAHMKWSLIQLARRFVRAHPSVARIVRPIRKRRKWNEKVAGFERGSAGQAPMLRQDGWQPIDEFLYNWTALAGSGLFESSWYDVHAAL